MANTGFISVAPELAAIAAQIVAVDTVVDNIRAVDVPAITAAQAVTDGLITTVDTVVDNIRDVDVPAITAAQAVTDGLITTVDTVVDNIRAVDVPALTAAIAAIQVKTEYEYIQDSTSSVTYVTLLDISGPGMVYKILTWTSAAGQTGKLKVNIDGEETTDIVIPHDAPYQIELQTIVNLALEFVLVAADTRTLNMEFKDNLTIEYKADTGDTVFAGCHYGHV